MLKWEPKATKNKPWHWKMFHTLWMWALLVALFMSLGPWLHQPVKFGADVANPPDSIDQLIEQHAWVDNYDGTCNMVSTGELFYC